ncbi:MAG: TonB-dependent receptor, partial [Deltaproteobacteria bacterium]|nr:TonB-dependent receptor [Deltaproteobacteria bacterium]
DAARAVHNLPGVVADGDMLASFHARGGETGDVVFLLDRVPLQNPYHLAGFNSLFNPDMISRIDFMAGAAPADVLAGPSAVMAVETWDGSPRQDGTGMDGAIDISASSLRALVMGPLGPENAFALAVRRSYLESYMQIMKWANIVDTAFAAPEYSEISARFAWNPSPEHRVLATWMHAGDSISLVDSDDASLVSFDGTFELRNSLGIVSLDHRFTPREGLTLQSTTAWTRDRSRLSRDFGGVFDHDVISHRYFGRTDLTWEPASHVVQAGVDLSYHYVETRGVIEDRRTEPTWHNAPLADYDRPTMDVRSSLHYPEASAYLQETWNGPVKLRVGARGTWVGLTDEVLLSPRAGLSVPLPTGTIPKVSWGIYHNTPRDPQTYDRFTGNPDLHSERAMHTVVGIDQAIPLPGEEAGGLLRVEGYWIELDDLVVNPDNREAVEAGTTWTNDGSGTNRGVDVMVAGRSGRVQGMFTYGYLVAERNNPLNSVFPTHFAPAQDQRHTLGATVEFQLSPRWRTTARYSFHTGRPVSTVDLTDTGDSVALTCLNCERLGAFHNIDLRVEWRKAMKNYRLSFYAELLNATHFQSDFVPIVSIEDGELVESMFHHLPIRPFLGVRADF